MFKPNRLQKTLVVLLSLFFSSNVFAQANLQNAWQVFFNNKPDSAAALFNQAIKQNNHPGDALLGLSLIAEADQAPARAFDYFSKFYAQSNNPAPYVYALWTTPCINSSFGKHSPQQLALLKQIAANTTWDGMIAAMANWMIGSHYEAGNQISEADAAFNNIHSIQNWQITGEFENISTSGFDRTYPVIDHPEADALFAGKYGAKTGWHDVTDVKRDQWMDFTYYSSAENSIVFSQTFVNSPESTEAQMRIGVSGSVKVWVNDALVLSVPEERNNDLDSYIQTIRLNKGYNRVLVQIGESYAGRLNFLLRITDNKGVPLSGLASVAKAQPYTKETGYASEKIEPFAITYFKDAIKNNPQDYLPKILLANAYMRNDQTFEARQIIEELRKVYPNSTFLNLMLDEVFNREDNRTGAETLTETIKNADPQSTEGLMLKYSELFQQKEYDKAAAIVKQLEDRKTEQQLFIFQAKIGLANANKNQDELIKLGDEAYKAFPDNKDIANLEYAIEKEARKNPKAIDILKKYVADNDSYAAAKELSEAYFTAGDAASGIKVLLDEIKKDPYAVGIYANLGNKYYQQQQYAKSEESYLNCIRIAPTIASYYVSLGKINEMMGNKDKAINYYLKGLEFDPNDYESIDYLRKLQNKKDIFSYFTDPDVDAEVRNAPKASDYPDDNVVMLDQEVQKVVYPQGGSEERQFVTTKILTQKGIDDWKEYAIDYDNWQSLIIEVAEVIKANGTKVPAERNENNLVFTNLEIGDVINIRYRLKNYSKGKLAGHFWDSFYFTNGTAHIVSKYSLLIAKDKKFNYTFSQKPIEVVKTSPDGEFDMYVWQNQKQDALQWEDKMPPLDDVANVLYLTSIPDWKFISDWYNDLASAKARTNYEVKQVISDIFKGQGNLTDFQKVEKIYHYITGNISYSSVSFRQSGLIPQNPSAVINTRIGDCKDVATLFVAMCKEAGITAHLVLVKTHDNGVKGMPLPSIDFNHCMAKVNLNNKEYYLELTNQYLPFLSLFNSEINSTILDIDPATGTATKYLDPSTRKSNDIKRNTTISFKDKDMIIDEKTYKTAAIAGSTRENVADQSQKDRLKSMKQGLSSLYPDNSISVLDYRDVERNNPRDTVYMHVAYQLNNVLKSIGGISIFTLPWSDNITANDLQINLPRYSGIELSQVFGLDNETEVITLNLAPGKNLVEAVAPVSIKNDIIEYSITPKQVGKKVIITRTIKIKKDFVPADQVPEFSTLFKKMIESDAKELAMK